MSFDGVATVGTAFMIASAMNFTTAVWPQSVRRIIQSSPWIGAAFIAVWAHTNGGANFREAIGTTLFVGTLHLLTPVQFAVVASMALVAIKVPKWRPIVLAVQALFIANNLI
jgi:hypothetical protein